MRRRRERRFLFGVAGLVTILAACGGTVGTGTHAGATGGGGPITTDATTGSMSTGGGVSGGCGGIAGTPCAPADFCSFQAKTCGAGDVGGTCGPRPSSCPNVLNPTCGCDGKVYDNECLAQKAGVDADNNGVCTAPPGGFACGAHFCSLSDHYCEEDGSHMPSIIPSSYSCLPLPAACGGVASCACLSKVMCGAMCTQTPDGGYRVLCPG
jgi:hypothetical protein